MNGHKKWPTVESGPAQNGHKKRSYIKYNTHPEKRKGGICICQQFYYR